MASIVAEDAVDKRVLLIDKEAIAGGAIEAGIEVMTAYSWTSSSGMGETLAEIADEFEFYIEWSTNEKVAFEVAADTLPVAPAAQTFQAEALTTNIIHRETKSKLLMEMAQRRLCYV